MKYIRLIAGPASAFSIILLASPFWWLRISNDSPLIAIAWTVVWLTFEVIWILRRQTTVPRLLTHLRWGPLVVLIVALVTVMSFDQVKTYQSRQMIRDYVYHGTPYHDAYGNLNLYSDYRGWCGNGVMAALYDKYIEAAAKGFESNDAAVRARAVQASYEISSGGFDHRFVTLIEKALEDSDPNVRALACEYRSRFPQILE